jgi:hypothetical protein
MPSVKRERMAGRRIGEAASDARQSEHHVYRLGDQLARLPDEDPRVIAFTKQFHDACHVMHDTQMHWEQIRNGSRTRASTR